MISRETLKQEIDALNDSQLTRIASFVELIKAHAQNWMKAVPFWQNATPAERSRDFRKWVSGLQKGGRSLSDEAFDRENIYE